MNTPKLDRIVASVRARSAERRRELPLVELSRRVAPDPRRRERVRTALTKPELAYIAALERASPSGGLMLVEDAPDPGARTGPKWRALARAYAEGGVDVLVVGTEADHYHGELADIRSVAFTGLPVMRADFLVDEGMVLESALHGADAIQVIVAILDDATLGRLCTLAREYGIAVMLEVHDERQLERALPHAHDLIGVNARDRRTMAMDPGAFARLLPRVPDGILRVALSGIATDDDMRRARDAGADVALAGGALMKAADPAAMLRGWRAALRGR